MRYKYKYFLLFIIFVSSALQGCQAGHSTKTSSVLHSEPLHQGIVADSLYFRTRLTDAGIDHSEIKCNSDNWWMDRIKDESELAAAVLEKKLKDAALFTETESESKIHDIITRHMMSWIVRTGLILREAHNFGAIILDNHYWTDKNGVRHPLVIFRTAYTTNPEMETSCFKSLLEHGQIEHVVNIYGDDFIFVEDLDGKEIKTAATAGATYALTDKMNYGPWRHIIAEHPEPGVERDEAMRNVARLINEQVLMPGGSPPRGNILIHCGGGMHRTGMVIGILQKVINERSMNEISAEYRYHVSYKNETQPGGFEQGNLDFIRDFDHSLIAIPDHSSLNHSKPELQTRIPFVPSSE